MTSSSSSSSSSSSMQLSPGLYEIQSIYANRFLNVAGGGREDGTPVQLWNEERGNPHNLWRVLCTSDGLYEIESVHAGRFLNLCGGGMEDGAHVHLWNDIQGSNPHNVWRIIKMDDGVFEIQSAFSNRFLNVAGGLIEDGTPVQMWNDEPGVNAHNQWAFHLVMPILYHSGECIASEDSAGCWTCCQVVKGQPGCTWSCCGDQLVHASGCPWNI